MLLVLDGTHAFEHSHDNDTSPGECARVLARPDANHGLGSQFPQK